MKIYLALNENGTIGNIGFQTKIAVLSILNNTSLLPVMMYIGNRNDYTLQLERLGVEVVDCKLPYISLIEEMAAQGKYTTATVGHWLRTNISLEELREEFVLYADIDTFFRFEPAVAGVRPKYFAAAPEFKPDGWNYFNAGVMLINLPNIREEYSLFERYITDNLQKRTYNFNDQSAYNEFYKDRWDKLDPQLNWKPYWGANKHARIVHFHGPKICDIEKIVDDEWDWSTGYGQQLGSLFHSNIQGYFYYMEEICTSLPLGREDTDRIERLLTKISTYDAQAKSDIVDLSFMNFELFPK